MGQPSAVARALWRRGAVHFDALGGFGLVAVVLFLVNLTVAYAYEWRRGGLDWD